MNHLLYILASAVNGKIEHHPNVNPATGLRWNGAVPPPDELGITMRFTPVAQTPRPFPLSGLKKKRW